MIRVSKFRRTNDYWYVRYWIDGQAQDESARTKCESVAETCRIRRELEINSGLQPVRYASLSKLIPLYLDFMLVSTTARHKHEVERILNVFTQLCGRKSAGGAYAMRSQQITPRAIDQYVNQRQQKQLHTGERLDARGRRIVRIRPVSNVTLRTELRYLSGFFNWCCRQRPPYLRENPIPLSNARQIKSDAKQHYMITDEEFNALLSACETPSQYLFLLLGWWTGGRRGEILALYYYHFDFEACRLSIAHKKNNMHSVIPLSETIIELVKRLYRGAKEADRLFPSDPLPSHGFARLCKKAGIRHHRFHDFRISTSMKIKSGGFDASLAGLWVGNQAATNRAHYSDLGAVATQISSLLEVSDLPPVPWQNT